MLLDARIQEVVRTLPSGQTEAIGRYSEKLAQASTHIEESLFHTVRRMSKDPLSSSVVPKIISTMALRDLEYTDRRGFSRLTPPEAMVLARVSTTVAEDFAKGVGHKPEEFYQAAVGIVGLHFSILGSEERAQADEAQGVLSIAVRQYKDVFILRLSAHY